MRRLSSGCVTFAMKLPPTIAMVFPSNESNPRVGTIGVTADGGTGTQTVYVGLPPTGTEHTPPLHSPAYAVAQDAVIAAIDIILLIVAFRYMYIDINEQETNLLH